MTYILLGLLGVGLGVGFLIAGFLLGLHFGDYISERKTPEKKEYTPTEEDLVEIEKERERLRADQRAFHDLMGYSADVAYGSREMPGKG